MKGQQFIDLKQNGENKVKYKDIRIDTTQPYGTPRVSRYLYYSITLANNGTHVFNRPGIAGAVL